MYRSHQWGLKNLWKSPNDRAESRGGDYRRDLIALSFPVSCIDTPWWVPCLAVTH
jgi:hypothetical protein